MLKIRLQKTGKKNAPSYRVVLCEHTSPPQGKFIEILGHYNPRLKQKGFKKERIEHWISKGAQASPTVHNLLIDEKIIQGKKVKAWRAKKKKEGEKKPEVPKVEGETPVEESKPEEPKEETSKEEKPVEQPEQPEKPLEESKTAPEEPSKLKPEISEEKLGKLLK